MEEISKTIARLTMMDFYRKLEEIEKLKLSDGIPELKAKLREVILEIREK